MSFAIAIIANLVSVAIGAGLALVYERWVRLRRSKVARWFWNPLGVAEVQIFLGTRGNLLTSERNERFLTVSDAEVFGRLSTFLEEFFQTISVVKHIDDVDWSRPIIAVGGGNANQIFQNVDISEYPEYRYDSADHYSIVNRDGSQRFVSVEPEVGVTSSSYAIVGRYLVKSERYKTSAIVVGGAYGPSTLKATSHLLDKRSLQELNAASLGEDCFQAIIRVIHHDSSFYTSELSAVAHLESLDRKLIAHPAPRPDIPVDTVQAAEEGREPPHALT